MSDMMTDMMKDCAACLPPLPQRTKILRSSLKLLPIPNFKPGTVNELKVLALRTVWSWVLVLAGGASLSTGSADTTAAIETKLRVKVPSHDRIDLEGKDTVLMSGIVQAGYAHELWDALCFIMFVEWLVAQKADIFHSLEGKDDTIKRLIAIFHNVMAMEDMPRLMERCKRSLSQEDRKDLNEVLNAMPKEAKTEADEFHNDHLQIMMLDLCGSVLGVAKSQDPAEHGETFIAHVEKLEGCMHLDRCVITVKGMLRSGKVFKAKLKAIRARTKAKKAKEAKATQAKTSKTPSVSPPAQVPAAQIEDFDSLGCISSERSSSSSKSWVGCMNPDGHLRHAPSPRALIQGGTASV